MDEQERLEIESKRIKEELKQLNLSLALGKLKDDSIIKEKKAELFKIVTALELSKISNKEENIKRR